MWMTQIYHVCAAAGLRFNYGAYINTIIIIIIMVILMLVVMTKMMESRHLLPSQSLPSKIFQT